jgi:hypothetical protein
MFHGCFIWQVFFFCGALLACDGSFSLTFCFFFSNASLAVGFVVLLLLSSYACAPASRAGLKLFAVALLFPTRRLLFSSWRALLRGFGCLLLHLLLGLVGACSPRLDFYFVLHEGCSCFCLWILFPSFREPFFPLVRHWLSSAAGWMFVGPGCLLMRRSVSPHGQHSSGPSRSTSPPSAPP